MEHLETNASGTTLYTIPFSRISAADIASVGGKNASLGEMYSALKSNGIRVPDGFAVSAHAYRMFLRHNGLEEPLSALMQGLERVNFSNLAETGAAARKLLAHARLPEELAADIVRAYRDLCLEYGANVSVAVRSSATAEDLPGASFAGQHESFLNVSGEQNLLKACQDCYVSLFTDRAIKYREDKGFEHMKVNLSAGVQKMVRSDMASSGVAFTLEPESGFRNVVHVSASWGLGENIVKGSVNPDEFTLFKPALENGKKALLSVKTGSKEKTMVYNTDLSDGGSTMNRETPAEKRTQLSISREMAEDIGRCCLSIEKHYGMPMDIEWAIDGQDGLLYIVQARPETAHSNANHYLIKTHQLLEKGELLAEGIAIGTRIASGLARVLNHPGEINKLQKGDVLVTRMTNPDWDPVMKKAAALVTDQGGRTSHASIVARELGLTAVVGTLNGTANIRDGEPITISCAEGKTGHIYKGLLKHSCTETDFKHLQLPRTRAMMILGDPEQAFRLSFYPNNGIGLMRLEFIINSSIGIHPMALLRFNELKDPEARNTIERLCAGYASKADYFTDKLSQAVGTIAAAFYPKEVIVRMSDFKTNEYANLCGGRQFEPEEENPMLGFRGASRYYHDKYREGFGLECKAMKIVREDMGLNNVKLMIPFCRTTDEGRRVIAEMEKHGLKRGENGLEVYVMAEIPSNVLLAEEFAQIFDGFSIGSNDLTQLTLGIDRDSVTVSELFDENNPAARQMMETVITKAKQAGSKIGLCGQAPSDSPEFAGFLVNLGIDSISFNPDALIKGIQNMLDAERNMFEKLQ